MSKSQNFRDGLQVVVWKLGKAGGYDVRSIANYFEKSRLVMSNGEPFNCALREAELLATVIDAQLIVEDELVRKISQRTIKKP